MNYLKRIFIFLIKEIFSFFIKLALFLIVVFLLVSTFISKKEIQKNTLKNNSYILLDLSEKFTEKKIADNIFEEGRVNFYSLIKEFRSLEKSKKVKGIILKLDNLSLNLAQIEELSEELEHLKDNGINIISYLENVNRKNLYLASFSKEIYMPKTNSTTVNVFPYYKETLYKKNLLDKLGIKVNIVNTGEYKTYGEEYAKSKMSSAAREDITRILEKSYQSSLDVISKNYKYDRNRLLELIESGDLVAASSQDLKENNLISGYTYWNELKERIGEKNIVSFDNYVKNYSTTKKESSKNKISVLTLEGEIVQDSEMERIYIDPDSVIKKIDEVEKNKDVRGVVIRINSPGGSALTSDKINMRLKKLMKTKKVYVSMGGVAASGGYYIASNANKIFADKNTVTGSIGVISMIPEFSGLIKKVGLNSEKIAKGKYSDINSFDIMTEERRNKILKANKKVYSDFLNEVSQGRKIKIEDLEKIAGGRVWLGEEAIQIGLVDEIGGLFETINILSQDLGISNDYEVLFFEDNFDIKNIYEKYSKFLKIDFKNINSIRENILQDTLLNKPIMYMPYEIFE